ncbi:hypothetical protein, partial [Escherichia coli]|uniref:hypothetical protein n=1 Tax=Escherichia coli TaxID=562 RepID=UPI001FF3BB06
REKQKGSRGIRRGQRYRLVFQFPIRELGGITRNQHLLHLINHGLVDPLSAHFISPIDEDKYSMLPEGTWR